MNHKSNPHAWFFTYVTALEGYNKDFAKVIREGIVLEFTDGATGSLSELYSTFPELYRQMKHTLLKEKADELDKARKRLIAALFSFLTSPPTPLPEERGESRKPTMHYVKSVACSAAKVADFNTISLDKLKYLYRIFGTKSTKNLTDAERKLVWSALRKEHQN